MAEIPQITISDFKKLTTREIKKLKSIEVWADGEYLFTAIIPPVNAGMAITDNIKTQAEYLGARGNTVGGLPPEQVLGKELINADVRV